VQLKLTGKYRKEITVQNVVIYIYTVNKFTDIFSMWHQANPMNTEVSQQ